MENGNIDRLYRQLERIENKLDKVTDDHDDRLRELERRHAEQSGGWKVLAIIASIAGTVGGVIATVAQALVPPRY